MVISSFEKYRRQPFLGEESYLNTLRELEAGLIHYQPMIDDIGAEKDRGVTSSEMLAAHALWIFQLKFTAGEPFDQLAGSLDGLILSYENWAAELEEENDLQKQAVFDVCDSIDDYVDYLNLLSIIILLRRTDLLDRAANLLAGTSSDCQDAVIEDLLSFFLPSRPSPDSICWGKSYHLLIEAIDADSVEQSSMLMRKHVKKWYPSMKGQASFWGKHQHITPEYSGYLGYWAMCAAAFTYLLGLDDSSYRDEVVYPRDLVDYARSLASERDADPSQLLQLRVMGGHACTRTGFWFTPARADSRTVFKVGDIMPDMPHMADASYGATIWQWAEQQ